MKKIFFQGFTLAFLMLNLLQLNAQSNSWQNANFYRFQSSNGGRFDISMWTTPGLDINTNRSYFRFNNDIRVQSGGIGSNGNDLQLKTGATNHLTILSSNGNTGLRTTNPQFDFQIHGIYDYIVSTAPSSIGINNDPIDPNQISAVNKSSINYGKAARIGLTNTTVGNTKNDGGFIMFADDDFYLQNQEDNGNMFLGVNGLSMALSGVNNRIWVGGTQTSSMDKARMNIAGGDNGLYIETNLIDRYGISVRVKNEDETVFQSFSSITATQPDFKIKGGGEVYARKYITTLSNFPDYVFEKDYALMPLSELRTYINANGHLPNMPSATEAGEEVDLGELNRLLTEKVEELTLYILELEEKLEKDESENTEERVTALEEAIRELQSK